MPRCGLPVVLCVLTMSSPAWAQGPMENVNDGHALLRECGAALEKAAERAARPDEPDVEDAGFDIGQCLGLVSGVWHTHMLMVDEFGGDVAFCPSREISTGQMARIVNAYLEENPDELSNWDTVLIMRAFMASYPCTRR